MASAITIRTHWLKTKKGKLKRAQRLNVKDTTTQNGIKKQEEVGGNQLKNTLRVATPKAVGVTSETSRSGRCELKSDRETRAGKKIRQRTIYPENKTLKEKRSVLGRRETAALLRLLTKSATSKSYNQNEERRVKR